MKYISTRIKTGLLLAFSAIAILSSCNKDVEKIAGPAPVLTPITPTLATLLDDPTFSIFKAAVVRDGLLPTLANTSLRFTMFIPNDAAMTASGLSLAVINALPIATALDPLVRYHIIPQTITSASIPTTFPNFQYPTIYNPLPAASALLRLTTSPSNRNGYWLNNIPIVQLDIPAVNGVAHRIALASAPPSRYLWDRISADLDMTYLKAAIQRADSGLLVTSSSSLQWALSNLGPNLTVYAPTDAAFKAALTSVITAALIAQGVPPATAAAQATALAATPAVFSNPALYGSLTAATVKGIVVYHMMGYRVFLNNFPTTPTAYPTLLNGGIPTHPGVTLKVTFTGPTTITSATIKGLVNATASNILINPTPDPGGTSDQHFINGTLHKIDQVLFPQ